VCLGLAAFGYPDVGEISDYLSFGNAFIPIALLLGFVCDMLFVALTRLTLTWSTKLDSVPKILTVIVVNIMAAVALYGLPDAIVQRYWSPSSYREQVGNVAYVVMLSNCVDVAVAGIFVIVALLMLAHKLLWPMLENPLYALQRTGIIGRRRLLVTVGFTLVTLSTGLTLDRVQKILEALSG